MDPQKIGSIIKLLRKKNNLTQEEFASSLNVTFQAVSKWEVGKSIPDISTLKLISEKYNINISELLNVEEQKKKKTPWILIIIAIIAIVSVVLYLIFNNANKDFEFKTITTTCSKFNITGSAAYNKEMSSIYISNVNYCGGDDKEIYSYVKCILYEKNDNIESIISINEKMNTNLTDYLKNVKFYIKEYSTMCKDFNSAKLFLDISAIDYDGKTIVYTIPIELKDNCE